MDVYVYDVCKWYSCQTDVVWMECVAVLILDGDLPITEAHSVIILAYARTHVVAR